MPSTSTRRTRRLLVTAGVMTLGLSVASPAAVWASNAGGDAGGSPAGQDDGTGDVVEETTSWICKPMADTWELIRVNDHALPAQLALGSLEVVGEDLGTLEELAHDLEIDLTSTAGLNRLGDGEEAALGGFCQSVAQDDVVDLGDEGLGDDGLGDDGLGDDGLGDDGLGDEGLGDEGLGDDGLGDDGLGDEGLGDDGLGDDGLGDDGLGGGETPTPAIDTDAETPRQPQPVVVISTDQVEKPVVTPVVTPVVSEDQTEVLGVTTTRTPTGGVAGSTVQTLPRTGSDHTAVLALAGGALVLAGLALELAGRRTGAAGGQLPAT